MLIGGRKAGGLKGNRIVLMVALASLVIAVGFPTPHSWVSARPLFQLHLQPSALS
jgi:hypothetical protein